jgi:hypothetical protein
MGQGIGRWMLSDAVRRVRALRPGPLRIASDPHAEGFYLKMGARRVGALPADVEGTKRELPLLELDTERWEEGITFGPPGREVETAAATTRSPKAGAGTDVP